MSTSVPGTSRIETITIRSRQTSALWNPIVGSELTALLKRKALSDGDSAGIEQETCRILSKCVPPDGTRTQRTGLVIGYVQSGKTLSFTALTALARDNAYRLVIILAGTTTNLVEQSYERLNADLDIKGGQQIWLFANPSSKGNTREELELALQTWKEYPDRPERCPTVVLVAMKNHRHLLNLAALLSSCDVKTVSTLIVDDEGDQAGLNNKVRQKEESTTYSCIRLLRKEFPTHTYLLYTATPQAPLLISRIDMLSPEFADVIEPGQNYVGGQDLFKERSCYVESIPAADLPNDDSAAGPPKSLERALRLFYVGVAAGLVAGAGGKRSMMIHPSQRREWHRHFAAWITSAKTTWVNLLGDKPNSPDRRELIQAFREAHKDLGTTESYLPPFDAVEKELKYAIHSTQIHEVNASAGKLPTIAWGRHYSHILVGGTGLDRGFTVEGLTVTYMPRGAGVGNADTVQQRGRFFGYKRAYIGIIRIFLEPSVERAFRRYVEHERSMRESLVTFRDRGRPLTEWRRAFFLDRSMSPTRSSVLSLDYMRGRSKEWIYPKTPHLGDGVLDGNRRVVQDFLARTAAGFFPDDGDKRRTDEQRHLVAGGLRLKDVYRELLVPLMATGDDLLDLLHVRLQIERGIEDSPEALCDVYQMRPSAGSEAYRGLDKDGAIKNLLQGSNVRTGYPGDRAIRSESRVTVQIHILELRNEDRRPIAWGVPVVAVSVPEPMRADLYQEPVSD